MKKIYIIILISIFALPSFAKKDKIEATANQTLGAIKHIEIYNSVLRELEINYVDTINHEKLIKLSLGRMLYGLDPYTSYFPASDAAFPSPYKGSHSFYQCQYRHCNHP